MSTQPYLNDLKTTLTTSDFEVSQDNGVDDDGCPLYTVSHRTMEARFRDDGENIITEPTTETESKHSEAFVEDCQRVLSEFLLGREHEERGYAFVIHYDEGPEIEFSEPFAHLMMDDGFDVSIISWGNEQ